MRVVSTALFAVAAVAASATAASLDVEPIESTPTTTTAPADLATIAINPSLSNATSNATRGHKIGVQAWRCSGMDNANWDDFKYACVWTHNRGDMVKRYFNQFFQRYDGSVVFMCNCDQALAQYDPWGSRWKFSNSWDSNVMCYTRDGTDADFAKYAFNNYNC